ncbi:MAG: hypothetical protein R3B40_32525 [Polyangiales bacterium]
MSLPPTPPADPATAPVDVPPVTAPTPVATPPPPQATSTLGAALAGPSAARTRSPASWSALLTVLAVASLAYGLSALVGAHVPTSPLVGAVLAFGAVAVAISGVAVLSPTATPRELAVLLLPLGVLVAVALARSSLPLAVGAGLINAALLAFGAVLGSAVGGRVEHAGHLVLLAWVASAVDILSVFAPEGPTAQIIANPETALPLVTLSWPIYGTARIEPLIGVGDVAIAAVYGAAARATSLPRRRVVWGLMAGFALTFVALLAFEQALPALPMLSLGVVVALAPASLRIPAADRRKGVGFAALITALIAARLGTWLLAP